MTCSERVFFFLIPCNQRATWIGVRAWECVFGQEGGQNGGFLLFHWSSGHSDLKLRPSSTFMLLCRQTLTLKRVLSKWQYCTFSIFFFSIFYLAALLHKYFAFFLAAYSFRWFIYCHCSFALIMNYWLFMYIHVYIYSLYMFMSFSIIHFSSKQSQNARTLAWECLHILSILRFQHLYLRDLH